MDHTSALAILDTHSIVIVGLAEVSSMLPHTALKQSIIIDEISSIKTSKMCMEGDVIHYYVEIKGILDIMLHVYQFPVS